MLKFATVIDEQTKACNVGLGTNSKFYESIGMTLQEVEQGHDGQWYLVGHAPQKSKEQIEAEAIAQAKTQRAEAVANIVVEVEGMVFDGDEVSQDRMARSAVAMTDDETITWVLHDNTIAQVSKAQLLKALRLSGEEQTRLWTMPYEVKQDE